jgi:hypothetical protein
MAHYEDVMQRILSRGGPASQMAAETGIDMATDPLAFAGGASVVNRPNPMYQSYNPAGAYAEAGRTVPNRVSEQAMAMNQLTQPQGGVPSDLHNWNDPYGRPDDTPFYEQRMPYFGDASVVQRLGKLPTQRIPTERELMVSTQEGVENSDRAFSRLHSMWAQGHPFFDLDAREAAISGAEGYGTEGVGELPEFTEIYLQVPDEAKRYAHANKHDPKVLAQFEEKYGFPLDVSVEIIR